ncbi:MAG: hypothetical protein ACRC20_10270 [Segniliparus sp.]|uniref:hypothetical protein n=1 Tax=Segniliparus sp. TaxID=2804064 RepID=UPI003F387DDB
MKNPDKTSETSREVEASRMGRNYAQETDAEVLIDIAIPLNARAAHELSEGYDRVSSLLMQADAFLNALSSVVSDQLSERFAEVFCDKARATIIGPAMSNAEKCSYDSEKLGRFASQAPYARDAAEHTKSVYSTFTGASPRTGAAQPSPAVLIAALRQLQRSLQALYGDPATDPLNLASDYQSESGHTTVSPPRASTPPEGEPSPSPNSPLGPQYGQPQSSSLPLTDNTDGTPSASTQSSWDGPYSGYTGASDGVSTALEGLSSLLEGIGSIISNVGESISSVISSVSTGVGQTAQSGTSQSTEAAADQDWPEDDGQTVADLPDQYAQQPDDEAATTFATSAALDSFPAAQTDGGPGVDARLASEPAPMGWSLPEPRHAVSDDLSSRRADGNGATTPMAGPIPITARSGDGGTARRTPSYLIDNTQTDHLIGSLPVVPLSVLEDPSTGLWEASSPGIANHAQPMPPGSPL